MTAPEPDPQLKEVIYERTWEQNEDLGLNDMKTENYEQPKVSSTLFSKVKLFFQRKMDTLVEEGSPKNLKLDDSME